MGRMQRKINTGDLILSFVASQAPPSAATIWIAPKGVLKRIVVKKSNLNDLTINGPNVEMPPLGILKTD
jgi:hypothetical protein